MEHKPVKRSKYLIALSKDHHLGLLFCWKIKEGIRRNTELYRIKKHVNYFWEYHLKEHFDEEEALLFDRTDDPLCSQAKAEHQMLLNRLNSLNYYESEDRQEYSAFAGLLIDHIRFEEREVFPHLEAVLPVAVLNEVAEFLTRQHPDTFKDKYPDEFWIHNSNKTV